MRQQGHAVAFETQVPVYPFNTRPANAVIKHHILGLDGDEKLAFALVKERKIAQIALEDQLCLHSMPGNQRIAQPEAGALANRMRHVAPHCARIGMRQCSSEVNTAGAFASMTVCTLRRTHNLRTGKFRPRQFGLKNALVQCPLRLRAKRIKPGHGFRKHRRQIDRRFLRFEAHCPSRFTGFKRPRQAGETREILMRLERQRIKRCLQGIRLQTLSIAFPLGTQTAHPAARRKLVKQLTRPRVKRHISRQPGERSQVDQAGTGTPTATLAIKRGLPFHIKVGGLNTYWRDGFRLFCLGRLIGRFHFSG